MSTESAAPAPAPAPEEPKKKAGIGKRILTYVVGLIVAGVALYGFNYFTSDVAQAKPGDCASVTGPTTGPEYKAVGCDAAEANYVIGQSIGFSDPCVDSYSEITQTQRRGPKTKLCIAPIYVEGKCYSDANATNMDFKAVECSTPEAFVVKKIVKEATAPTCAEGEGLLKYTEAKLNYCIALATPL